MLRQRLATTAAVFALLPAFAAPARAGDIALNQVWSRLADINGELGSIETAEFSRDSQYIVTGSKFDNTVRIFRTSDGFETLRIDIPQEIERVAWAADASFIASVSEDQKLRVFDPKTGVLIFEFPHDAGIDALTVSNSGQRLVTGEEKVGARGAVRLFRTADWSIERTLDHGDTVNEVAFTPDDQVLATSGHAYVKLWDVASGRLLRTLDVVDTNNPDQTSLFINVQFSPDGRYLAAGATGGWLYVWDAATGELIRRFNRTAAKIETVAWTGDGRHLGIAGHGYSIDFFALEDILDEDIEDELLPFSLRVPTSDHLEYMAFNTTGTLFTSAHQDGTVQLWTFMSGDPTTNTRRHEAVKRIQAEAQRRP